MKHFLPAPPRPLGAYPTFCLCVSDGFEDILRVDSYITVFCVWLILLRLSPRSIHAVACVRASSESLIAFYLCCGWTTSAEHKRATVQTSRTTQSPAGLMNPMGGTPETSVSLLEKSLVHRCKGAKSSCLAS